QRWVDRLPYIIRADNLAKPHLACDGIHVSQHSFRDVTVRKIRITVSVFLVQRACFGGKVSKFTYGRPFSSLPAFPGSSHRSKDGISSHKSHPGCGHAASVPGRS